MATTVTVNPANEEMNALLDAIEGGSEEVLIERQGRLVARLVSPDEGERRRARGRARLLELVLDLHERNRDIPSDQLEEPIARAVREVREGMPGE